MEFIGGMVGLTIAWWSVALVIASLLFPIFWVWMLIDSVLRNDYEYPGGNGANEKLVWVLLIALVQFVAVFYYFMVYGKIRRGSVAPPANVAPQASGPQCAPQSTSAA